MNIKIQVHNNAEQDEVPKYSITGFRVQPESRAYGA